MTQMDMNLPKLQLTPNNVVLNMSPKVLTFHICVNLKLKWKTKAYCFRSIQWLNITVETTNSKVRVDKNDGICCLLLSRYNYEAVSAY